MLARHHALLNENRVLHTALTSLALIENCLSLLPGSIPPREAQVISRILYGISVEGIALDLGIAENTVIGYRRRFYDRLGISCFRELLVWYLKFFGMVRHRLGEC